jgi:hypothetical protein
LLLSEFLTHKTPEHNKWILLYGINFEIYNLATDRQNKGNKATGITFAILSQKTYQIPSSHDNVFKARYFGSGTQWTSMKWGLDWEKASGFSFQSNLLVDFEHASSYLQLKVFNLKI